MRAFLLVALALCLLPGTTLAAERARVVLPPIHPLTADCVQEAARATGMPVAALYAILATENGKVGEALRNKNGTWDLGPFQINTTHIKELSAKGISLNAVLCDGRVNALTAAWLLRREYKRTGNLWRAIGAYHSRTPHLQNAYIRRVQSNMKRLKKEGISMLFSSREAKK